MKGGTRVSTLGPWVGGSLCTCRHQEPGLGFWGAARLPYPDSGGFCSVLRSLRCAHART